jgi:hypothetical protein
VNELTARDTDSNSSNNYTLTYGATGNLTDDAESYEYEYDAFNRLRKIKNQSATLLAEYRYNGLGFMTGVHEDTDADGDADGSDKWFYPAYDEGWREVARFRESDSSPKDQFVNATAGLDGYGRSSYINDVVCRNKDANTAWTSASDGVLEERYFYCPNWRGDVSALVTSGRQLHECGRYSPYGVPNSRPGADTDSDGDCDAGDATQIQAWIDAPAYDVRGDVDLDGDVDGTDKTLAQSAPLSATGLAWTHLSHDSIRNTRSLSGLSTTSALGLLSVRAYAYRSTLGRWAQRDPTRSRSVDAETLNRPAGFSASTHVPCGSGDPCGGWCFFSDCDFSCTWATTTCNIINWCTCSGTCTLTSECKKGCTCPESSGSWWGAGFGSCPSTLSKTCD